MCIYHYVCFSLCVFLIMCVFHYVYFSFCVFHCVFSLCILHCHYVCCHYVVHCIMCVLHYALCVFLYVYLDVFIMTLSLCVALPSLIHCIVAFTQVQRSTNNYACTEEGAHVADYSELYSEVQTVDHVRCFPRYSPRQCNVWTEGLRLEGCRPNAQRALKEASPRATRFALTILSYRVRRLPGLVIPGLAVSRRW